MNGLAAKMIREVLSAYFREDVRDIIVIHLPCSDDFNKSLYTTFRLESQCVWKIITHIFNTANSWNNTELNYMSTDYKHQNWSYWNKLRQNKNYTAACAWREFWILSKIGQFVKWETQPSPTWVYLKIQIDQYGIGENTEILWILYRKNINQSWYFWKYWKPWK